MILKLTFTFLVNDVITEYEKIVELDAQFYPSNSGAMMSVLENISEYEIAINNLYNGNARYITIDKIEFIAY